jgi:hypothetical protein
MMNLANAATEHSGFKQTLKNLGDLPKDWDRIVKCQQEPTLSSLYTPAKCPMDTEQPIYELSVLIPLKNRNHDELGTPSAATASIILKALVPRLPILPP